MWAGLNTYSVRILQPASGRVLELAGLHFIELIHCTQGAVCDFVEAVSVTLKAKLKFND